MGNTVLVLGGTDEGRRLALALQECPHTRVIYALAGITRAPNVRGLATDSVHCGGFGGIAGLSDFLRRRAVSALIDATHPYATQMTAQAVEAATQTNTAWLRLARPAWVATPGDEWLAVNNLGAAAELLRQRANQAVQRVFLACGTRGLDVFADLPNSQFWLRAIEPPRAPVPANIELVYARGPFTFEAEHRCLAELGITALVCKNSGGEAAAAKLHAARALELPVIMVERPQSPARPSVSNVCEALLWWRQLANEKPRSEPAC
jgi:precorrin-6A/cobalt-precorrin-6A reductase